MKINRIIIAAIPALLLIVSFAYITVPQTAVSEPRIVLTPKPGPEPRINGTMVFGVRPGSPFLFTIPVTGLRPMKYDVLNLPKGLTCNPDNGQITGTIQTSGEYNTTFKVTNKLGSVQRKFKIVCGNTLALTPHCLQMMK